MKILLIYPRASFKTLPSSSWMPLSLPYLAGPLKQAGHEVRIMDRYADQCRLGSDKALLDKALLQTVTEFKPDLIGLNAISPLVFDLVETAVLIRRVFTGPLLAGGHHATALPEATLKKIPELDAVITGEGEYSLLHFAEGAKPQEIPGLWWRENGRITGSPAAQIADLDKLPFPDFSVLDLSYYMKRGLDTIRHHYVSSISLLASRGCAKKCEFCSESLTYGKGVRFHSPEYVVELVAKVYKDYGIEGIYFHDNDFLINRSRAEAICGLMIKRGLQHRLIWGIQARAEHIEPGIVRRLKQAGCVIIEVGIESDSQAVLDAMHKDSTVETNERAIRICQDEGMKLHVYMLTGLEGETLSDLERRLKWLKRLQPFSFSWSQLDIHPGTRLYQRLRPGVFEHMPWSQEAVHDYYHRQQLSRISSRDREAWMFRHYNPYIQKRRRLNLLRSNSPERLWDFLKMKAQHKISIRG